MNRREDPLLRQHRSRLLQLAEQTNIKPGRGSGKRRGQRQGHGSFGPSNGGPGSGGHVTLQDIVRSDPGYTPNIEHLVFPERKSSNPNLSTANVDGSPPSSSKTKSTSGGASGRSRLAQVFARHYSRGSSQDSTVGTRKNHVNSTSLDGVGGGHQPPLAPTASVQGGGGRRRWQSTEDQRPASGPDPAQQSTAQTNAQTPRRLSPAADVVECNTPRTDRNISLLHLRSTSDPWEVGSQGSSYSAGSQKSQQSAGSGGNRSGSSYNRGSSIPSLKRHDTGASTSAATSLKHRQDGHGQTSNSRRRDGAFLSSTSTSGELYLTDAYNRELSPVRWCDREVDGVYLGRSGWVQVQQRSLDESRRLKYDGKFNPNAHLDSTTRKADPKYEHQQNAKMSFEEMSTISQNTGTLPSTRKTNIKLADYHCSNSEPGKCPGEFQRVQSLDLQASRPEFLNLQNFNASQIAQAQEKQSAASVSNFPKPLDLGSYPKIQKSLDMGPFQKSLDIGTFQKSLDMGTFQKSLDAFQTTPQNSQSIANLQNIQNLQNLQNFQNLQNLQNLQNFQNLQELERSSSCSPHSIPESFSPPSVTPIISPPPAFQDVIARKSSTRQKICRNYAKAFIRSNAIDSDIISPPPSPVQQHWSSLPTSAARKSRVDKTRSLEKAKGLSKAKSAEKRGSQENLYEYEEKFGEMREFKGFKEAKDEGVGRSKKRQQDSYKMSQAKSLEDQSSYRRTQFVQRYLESSSSSSSSMGFRSLDSCFQKTMPRLVENTDSSIEGYEDGDEDENSLNLSVLSSASTMLRLNDSSCEELREKNGERISPSRKFKFPARRSSPGSESVGRLSFNSRSNSLSSSTSTSSEEFLKREGFRRMKRSPESRVRRSRSLQLPEKRSPGSRDGRERGERKRHVLQNRKAQSTEDTLNEDLLRNSVVIPEFLYGTRSRPMTASRKIHSRYDSYENEQFNVERQNYDEVYYVSSASASKQNTSRMQSAQSAGQNLQNTSNLPILSNYQAGSQSSPISQSSQNSQNSQNSPNSQNSHHSPSSQMSSKTSLPGKNAQSLQKIAASSQHAENAQNLTKITTMVQAAQKVSVQALQKVSGISVVGGKSQKSQICGSSASNSQKVGISSSSQKLISAQNPSKLNSGQKPGAPSSAQKSSGGNNQKSMNSQKLASSQKKAPSSQKSEVHPKVSSAQKSDVYQKVGSGQKSEIFQKIGNLPQGQGRRPKTLQRGTTTPNAISSDQSAEFVEFKELREYEEFKNPRDLTNFKEPHDRRDSREFDDFKSSRDPKDFKDSRESRDLKNSREFDEFKDPRDFKDFKDELKNLRELKDLTESLDRRNSRELDDLKIPRDFKESHDRRNSRELDDFKSPRDFKDFKDTHDRRNSRELDDFKSTRDYKEPHDRRNSRESDEPKNPRDFKDFKEAHDRRNSRESDDFKNPRDLKDPKEPHDRRNSRESDEFKTPGRDFKDLKDPKDAKEPKDFKDYRDFNLSPDTKSRCNSSTCDFWPHCSQRDNLYSPNQPTILMKVSQSYPSHKKLQNDSSFDMNKGSASSSPASLERMEAAEAVEEYVDYRERKRASSRQEKMPRSVLKASWSPISAAANSNVPKSSNGSRAAGNYLQHDGKRMYRKSERAETFEERRISPSCGQERTGKLIKSTSGIVSSSNTSSSSSSDIWVTTSDRTITKSPKNFKSSGASTPMEDAVAGHLNMTLIETPKDGMLSRPGSAPTRGEDAIAKEQPLEPQQRSLSLPKSFLAHNTDLNKSTSWQREQDSQGSSPVPSRSHHQPEVTAPHTAPVSPLRGGKERRRLSGLSKAQRRVKASSTPALLDHDNESQQWSSEIPAIPTTEHPLAEATIPLATRLPSPTTDHQCRTTFGGSSGLAPGTGSRSGQESVLQKFRKSFSLRFHKRGSKESEAEEERQLEDEEREEREASTSAEGKEETDQKFRFGPLVWRSSKERKKGSKAARNAKCNSGDSGIQIEMVSGGTMGSSGGGGILGGGDSSESHDTDAQDETDSPPTLRRRLPDKSRPQSELINQILIDKFKADLQNRSSSRHQHVRRTNSDLGGQRLLQWDSRSGYSHAHNYRRMLSTPSPIKTRPPRLSPRHSSHDIVTLRSNAKGRSCRTNLRRSLSQPLGINQLSPLMRTKTASARLPSGAVLSEDEHDVRVSDDEDDDDLMSDSESSIASVSERKKSFDQPAEEEVAILAEAVWDHVAMEPEELAFRAGDVIDVLDTMDKDWWWGCCGEDVGWFPAAFVRLRVNQEDTVEDCLAAMACGGSSGGQLRRRTSVSLLSNEQVRTSVVRELVQTERDFVKILRDVVEGYVEECRRRTDMFTEEQIETIFINVEELLDFQSEFLKELESRIDWSAPHKSCVGECFLNHRSGFRMYSQYCNSHPMATATLQELYQHNRYSKFFEACRLMRGLIEIPLDGYLLTPVQRICKYPLQLAELLKYTRADHPDYGKIKEALEAMRGVAVLINERKRRMESLEKLAAWQMRVEGWEGEDLIEVSSQLIYQGEAIRVTTGMWTNNIILFLFDHQLVYCKKDILKRNTYVYKGRIYLDTSEVIDVPDGKDHQLGVTVRHCLKVYSCVRDKWLLFCCRTAEEKRRWLQAMSEERRLVAQDRNDGLEFPQAAKQLARLAATRFRNCPPQIKPRAKTYENKRESPYDLPTAVGNHGGTNSLGRKVGTWFTFGSSKKNARQPQPS